MIKSKKSLLAAAAIAGIYASSLASYSFADDAGKQTTEHHQDGDKNSCKSKEGCKAKESCKSKEGCNAADKKSDEKCKDCDKDKNSCKAKESCKSKEGCGAKEGDKK